MTMLTSHQKVKYVEENIIHYSFNDKHLLELALTHKSAVHESSVLESYERLEFLGDSILGAIVASDLYSGYPMANEGELTKSKQALVEGTTLTSISKDLNLEPYIIFGNAFYNNVNKSIDSVLEDVFESIVGALYLDGGVEVAHEFIRNNLYVHMTVGDDGTFQTDDTIKDNEMVNAKNKLQEIAQRDLKETPKYKILSESGPDHDKTFTAAAMLDNVRVGRGYGSTKKEAESDAALNAIKFLTNKEGKIVGSRLEEASEE